MLKAAFKKTNQGWARFRVIIYTMLLVLHMYVPLLA